MDQVLGVVISVEFTGQGVVVFTYSSEGDITVSFEIDVRKEQFS